MNNLIRTLTPKDLFRLVRDIMADELSRSRGSAFDPTDALTWDEQTDVREWGIGLDSLERFTVASRLNETFSLYESGVEDNLLRAKTLGDTVEVIQAGINIYSDAIAFYSGGTTGTPKPRRHSSDILEQEIRFWRSFFEGRRRVIVTVPIHHIYGFLFGVLLPRVLDVDVVDARSTLLGGANRPGAGDLVVSVPFLWRQFLGSARTWGGGVWGISSTAPLPESIGSQACQSGVERLIEVYGSSETGGIGWRDHCTGEQTFSLLPFWRLVEPAAGVVHRDNPAGGDPLIYTLPDRIEETGDRQIRPTGRHDSVVQVGGHNVDLDELRRRIPEILDEVEDSSVRLGEDGRIKAFFVLKATAGDVTEGGLRRKLQDILPASALPSRITFGSRIPRDANGKYVDW